jgi:hypothetical protein
MISPATGGRATFEPAAGCRWVGWEMAAVRRGASGEWGGAGGRGTGCGRAVEEAHPVAPGVDVRRGFPCCRSGEHPSRVVGYDQQDVRPLGSGAVFSRTRAQRARPKEMAARVSASLPSILKRLRAAFANGKGAGASGCRSVGWGDGLMVRRSAVQSATASLSCYIRLLFNSQCSSVPVPQRPASFEQTPEGIGSSAGFRLSRFL